MEEVTAIQEVAVVELNQVQSDKASTLALITNDENMQRVMSLAKVMSESKVTVPKHLQGNIGDCSAIIIQASTWGMNPFAVAQKTHLVNGTLGYEAQLVNAVVQANKAIQGNFNYEYRGEGEAMECRVGAVLRGGSEITWGEWLRLSSVTTRNSPLWKTNPKQQMGYLQVKNWARLYCPGSILGVYTVDELQTIPEKELNTPPSRARSGAEAAKAAQHDSSEVIEAETPERNALIESLEKAAKSDGLKGFGETWFKLTSQQRAIVGESEKERIKAIAKEVTNGTGPSEASE